MYAETFYLWLTLVGCSIIFYLGASKQQTKYQVAALPFLACSTLVRSVGALSFIMPVFFLFHKLIRLWFLLIKPGTKPKLGCRFRCYRFIKSVGT